jgi:uncharacterized protein
LKRILICMSFAAVSSFANAAGFDCTKATTAIEKTICADGELSALDGKLMQAYKTSLSNSAKVDTLKVEQRTWISTVRNKCSDATCLKQAYAERIAQLDGSSPAAADQPQSSNAAASPTKPAEVAEPKAAMGVAATAPSPVTAAANAPAATANASAPAVSPAASQASSSPTHPGPGITDIFSVLFGVGMLVLIAGMCRPSLASRVMAVPTRKKIFGIMLVFLVPVAALSAFTKKPERIAYEQSVREQKEAEREQKEAERREHAQAQQAAKNTSSDAPSAGGQGRQSRFQAASHAFVAVSQQAVDSGATQTNPSCSDVFMSSQGEFSGEMALRIVDARKTFRNDEGTLTGIENNEARVLEQMTSNLRNVCRL